jgi:hypothetical protein
MSTATSNTVSASRRPRRGARRLTPPAAEPPAAEAASFFACSGSSPPALASEAPAQQTNDPATDEMPPELIEELGRLLGEALAADIRQYPNLAALKAADATTVESPPGHNRTASGQRRIRLAG